MKDERKELGIEIITRLDREQELGKTQRAQAFAEYVTNGMSRKMWLVNGSLKPGHKVSSDITGSAMGTESGYTPYLDSSYSYSTFSKNGPFGNAFAELESLGPIEFKNERGQLQKGEILSRADYQVVNSANDVYPGKIMIKGMEVLRFESSLRTLVRQYNELLKQQQVLEESDDQAARAALSAKIAEIEEELERIETAGKKFRRTTASLRQNFLLDPRQNAIKRTRLFAGPLVVDGGPGTGKTTLLIHRIQYMMSPEITEDDRLKKKLSNELWERIRNQQTGWIFFSPTALLKKYLENAMAAEGLEAHDETVVTWDQYRLSIQTALGLYGESAPFQAIRLEESSFHLSAGQLLELIGMLDAIQKEEIAKRFRRLESVAFSSFPWSKTGDQIRRFISPTLFERDWKDLIPGLALLSEQYSELRLSMRRNYEVEMKDASDRIQSRLTKEDKEWFKEFLRARRNGVAQLDEDVTEEENRELFEEEERLEGRLELDINRLIRKILRNTVLAQFDKPNSSFPEKDVPARERIQQFMPNDLSRLASLTIFVKYFATLLQGADAAVMKSVPRSYKALRKKMSAEQSEGFEAIKAICLGPLDVNSTNRKLVGEEADIVILQYLRLARLFLQHAKPTYDSSEQAGISMYKTYSKAMISVDEAADFTATQLFCMHQLGDPRVNAFTAVGDLMQQMNPRGIGKWEELRDLIGDVEIEELRKSYRQTPTLLKLAEELYANHFGSYAGFYAAMPSDPDEPKPLAIVKDSEEDRIAWVVKRIVELYRKYEGNIPNIAVFTSANRVKEVAKALMFSDDLVALNIRAKACEGDTDIGNANEIRVFDVALIKGMEFEAVFFLDVDDYSTTEKAILQRLIYVGVSRATYYLAITLRTGWPAELEPIKDQFTDGSWSVVMEADY
jgi:hypothetical protein